MKKQDAKITSYHYTPAPRKLYITPEKAEEVRRDFLLFAREYAYMAEQWKPVLEGAKLLPERRQKEKAEEIEGHIRKLEEEARAWKLRAENIIIPKE